MNTRPKCFDEPQEERGRENEDQLRGQLRGLFDAIPDAVWLKDAEGRWLAVNSPALQLFQLEGVDYWGKGEVELSNHSVTYREALLSCIPSDELAWNAGTLTHIAETLPFPDGTLGVFDLIKVPLFHPDGSRKGLVVIGRDITARTRAEEERDRLFAQELAARAAAEDAQRRATLLADASRILVGTLDYEAALSDVVQLAVPFLADVCFVDLEREPAGSSRVAMAVSDRSWNDVLTAAGSDLGAASEVRDLMSAPIRARGRLYGTLTFVSAKPDRYGVAERALCEDLAQRIALSIDNARLISELRESHEALAAAQEAFVRRERLAALGQLAAVVAHEVRNPLAAIYNSLGSLKKLQLFTGDAALLFGVVEEEASRLNRVVVELLDFVRPFHPTLEAHELREVIDIALSGVTRAHRHAESVRMKSHVSPALPPVKLDAHLMHVALMNVMSNALQAMPDGGELSVTAEPVRAAEGCFAQISVSDTGSGIPTEVLGKVFEPFFTSRASGTGLGLAIVRRIIDSHRGQVEIASMPGNGATIMIRLPIDAA